MIYVHIPFCRSFCSYCNFYSSTRLREISPVLESIKKEWIRERDTWLDLWRSGTFRLLLPEHPQLLAYERACGEERIRVCCNFSGAPAVLPPEMQGDCLLCDGVENGRMEPYGLCCVQLLHH